MTTRDLALGRASMAQLTDGGLVVLVDATAGTHRLVSLPGHGPEYSVTEEDEPLALSPDGSQLAFTWLDLSKTTAETTAGLAVLDLESGEIRKLSLRGRNDRPLRLSQVAWSPDGSHLVWAGDEALQWDEGGSSWRGPWRRAGVTAADRLTDHGVDLRTTFSVAVAVATDGTGYALSSAATGVKDLEPGSHLYTLRTGSSTQAPSPRKVSERAGSWNGAALSADGRTMVVGMNGPYSNNNDPYAAGLRTLDLSDPEAGLEIHPWDLSRSGTATQPLGWTADGALVVAHEANRGQWVSRWADAEATPVTEVLGTGESLTVATDLADVSASFPEPRWPVSDERRWTAALLALALAFSLALPVARLVRRRRARRNVEIA